MAKKDTVHPWQQIEEQAFHAFREWPLWLVLRERELAQQSTGSSSDAPSAAGTDTTTRQSKGKKAISQLCFAGESRNETGEISPNEGFER